MIESFTLCQFSGTFTEVEAHRSRLVLGWVTTREDRLWPGSVHRHGLKSMTDSLYGRHRADKDVK